MTEVDRKVDLLPDFETSSNQTIVDYFKQEPLYGNNFGKDSGVWQSYTLEEHTLMMMKQFDRYFSEDFDSSIVTKGQFRAMLALHDIGKPEGVELYGKREGRRRQHEFTIKIIPQMLGGVGFDDKTKAILTAIPTVDVMGSLLKKHRNKEREKNKVVIAVEEAESRVRSIAQGVDVNSGELFDLMHVYFLSDASSYTHDANPDMIEPPEEGDEDLDHLFIFDRTAGAEKGTIELIPELAEKVDALRQRLSAS